MRLSSTGQTSFNIMRGIMRTRRVATAANPTRCARLEFAQSALCLAPPRSAPQSVQRKASLALRSAVSGGAVLWPRSHRHPWRLRCCSAAASSCGSQSKRLSAWRPPLKGLYARPASSGCGGSCRAKGRASLVPASPASAARPGPAWSCKGQLRSGSGATERRSVACGLSAARTRRPRAVAPPCRRWRPGGTPSRGAGNGLSGKRNDRFVVVVIW